MESVPRFATGGRRNRKWHFPEASASGLKVDIGEAKDGWKQPAPKDCLCLPRVNTQKITSKQRGKMMENKEPSRGRGDSSP